MKDFFINIQTGERTFDRLTYPEFMTRLGLAEVGTSFRVSFYDDFADVSGFVKTAPGVFKKGTRLMTLVSLCQMFKAEYHGRFGCVVS